MLWDEPTDPADPTYPDETYSVGELAEVLAGVLDRAFPDQVWVRGEIRDLKRAPSGHVYFNLVEAATAPLGGMGRVAATLPVILSARVRPLVNDVLVRSGGAVRMTDGTEVRLCGRIDWYAPRGQLQLRMTGIDPAYTLGRLAAERERLLQVLDAEGLLRRNATLAMPAVPLVVGLVTSVGSAAEADFLAELERSGLAFRVLRVDCRVSGAHAASSVVAALGAVARAGPDVVALVRGGGARTDLAAFDDEALARAIAVLPVPVHTGIGHETDRSVADEVAHTGHKTPTACAQALVAAVRSYLDAVDECWADIARRVDQALSRQHEQIRRSARHASLAVDGALRLAEHRLEVRTGRVAGAARGRLRAGEHQLATGAHRLSRRAPRLLVAAERAAAALDARVRVLDPAAALARGWSITRRADGTVVRSIDDVEPGQPVRITVDDGDLHADVVSTSEHSPTVDTDG